MAMDEVTKFCSEQACLLWGAKFPLGLIFIVAGVLYFKFRDKINAFLEKKDVPSSGKVATPAPAPTLKSVLARTEEMALDAIKYGFPDLADKAIAELKAAISAMMPEKETKSEPKP